MMKSADIRLDTMSVTYIKDMVGRRLVRYKCDPFVFSTAVYGIVGVIVDDKAYAFTNCLETMDYFGRIEDVAIFRLSKRQEGDIQSLLEGEVLVDTPVGSKIKEIQIVNEHQKLYEDEVQTYDVWLTRGIVFVLEDGLEIALEKNVWFSEMITVKRGYGLADGFSPVSEFVDDWDKPYRGECSRETEIIR